MMLKSLVPRRASAVRSSASVLLSSSKQTYSTAAKIPGLMDKIKELRKLTNAPMQHCKTALEEEGGDLEKAKDWLRKKGLATASKKSSRTAAEGLVSVGISDDKKSAVLIEVNSETDFVSLNKNFQTFVTALTNTAVRNPSINTVDELNQANLTTEDPEAANLNGVVTNQAITDLIGAINENIKLRRINRINLNSDDNGVISTYVHNSVGTNMGKIACAVALKLANGQQEQLPAVEEFGKQLAMHIVAFSPITTTRETVPKDILERETNLLKEQIKGEGKPEHIAEKMLQGRLNKFYQEHVLLEQPWVLDNDIKVSQALKDFEKNELGNSGAKVEVVSFHKYAVGEGIEKEHTDFAAEVKAQAGL
eukprot:GEZU01006739.1.p2 GENE.GEZU01006739.1~~GEZU01006739.1.p2  ORF type:complete len:393 (+),score=195.61 GEZU01006739.1:87-1181(+)